MSYRDLAEAMITVSSNFATNLIIEQLGAQNIQRTTDAMGATGMHVLRGVEDDKAFQKGLNNSTTARALLTLMEAIARGQAVDTASSDEMIAILKRQKFNNRIPEGLPRRHSRLPTRPVRLRRFSTTPRSCTPAVRSCW